LGRNCRREDFTRRSGGRKPGRDIYGITQCGEVEVRVLANRAENASPLSIPIPTGMALPCFGRATASSTPRAALMARAACSEPARNEDRKHLVADELVDDRVVFHEYARCRSVEAINERAVVGRGHRFSKSRGVADVRK
jgi:hypothetical protein